MIDAPAVVAVGADHEEAAARGDAVARPDVDAQSRHVGGDRHRARFAGTGDDGGLLFLMPRVQDVMGHGGDRAEGVCSAACRLLFDGRSSHGAGNPVGVGGHGWRRRPRAPSPGARREEPIGMIRADDGAMGR